MSTGVDERSRMLGGLLCLGAIALGALFIAGVLAHNWWAIALPVSALVLFVLGLVTWIGWTIATVHVEAEGEKLSGSGRAGGATRGGDDQEFDEGGEG